MPREVQNGDRYSTVDRLHAAELRRHVESILPRTREQGEVERSVRSVGRELADERGHELMDVFADTAPAPQRGPVIYEHAHLFKAFRLSIL
jgi:hypothetical protein